jgi:hypothetical protein
MTAEEGLDEEANMYFLLKRYANYSRMMAFITSLILFAGLIVVMTGIPEYVGIAVMVSVIGGCGLCVSYILMKLFKMKANSMKNDL